MRLRYSGHARAFQCVGIVILVCLSAVVSTEAVADPQIAADPTSRDDGQRFDRMRAAAREARTGVKSAIATAWFKRWSQKQDEIEPQITTDGKLQLYLDDSKYHVRFTHQKMWRRTTDQRNFQLDVANVVRNRTSQVFSTPAGMVNWKPENVFIVHDSRTISSAVFSSLIRPHGIRAVSHRTFQEIHGEVDCTLADPTYFVGGFFNLENHRRNLGKDAVETIDLPDGGYRATFRVKNAPNVRVNLDAFPKDGFNVSAYRIFNDGQELPASAIEATWKKVNEQWIVTKLTSEKRFRAFKYTEYTKEMLGYYSVEVNPWVDPTAFTKASMSPDWRPRAAPEGDRVNEILFLHFFGISIGRNALVWVESKYEDLTCGFKESSPLTP